MPIAVDRGALYPFKGLILDHYRPDIDEALLVICANCGKWRVARGNREKLDCFNKCELKTETWCYCKE